MSPPRFGGELPSDHAVVGDDDTRSMCETGDARDGRRAMRETGMQRTYTSELLNSASMRLQAFSAWSWL